MLCELRYSKSSEQVCEKRRIKEKNGLHKNIRRSLPCYDSNNIIEEDTLTYSPQIYLNTSIHAMLHKIQDERNHSTPNGIHSNIGHYPKCKGNIVHPKERHVFKAQVYPDI